MPELDELPPSDLVGDGADELLQVEPLDVEEVVLGFGFADAVEVAVAAPVVVGVEEAVPVAELVDVVAAAPAATAVCGLLAAYASARCNPRPPTARVEASNTPPVQRRVLRRATFTGPGLPLVMTSPERGEPAASTAGIGVRDEHVPATFARLVRSLWTSGV